ncbi:hypothetical protein, partial [Pseudoalteromonas luteoviolacea]
DPSGYFFKKLAGTLLSRKGAQMIGFSLGGLTGAWLGGRAYDRIMGSEGLQTVVAVALNFVPGCQVWCSALFSAQVNYYHTGNVGSALRAGATSAAIAGVFYGIGQGAVALDAVGSPLHIAAHAVAGGIIADVQGGNFGHGFWSAGLTKWAQVGRYVPNDLIAGTIVSAVIGGTVSEISGGKFANGATTAAFQFAMNHYVTRYTSQLEARGGRIDRDQWTTEDFLKHYWKGGGKTVYLKDVGLADDFEGNWVTDEVINVALKNALKLKDMSIDGDTFGYDKEFLLLLQGRLDGPDSQNMKNPLFSLGSGYLRASGTCSAGTCNFNFSYTDIFEDILSMDHKKWWPYGGVEMPFSNRYYIHHNFRKTVTYK